MAQNEVVYIITITIMEQNKQHLFNFLPQDFILFLL